MEVSVQGGGSLSKGRPPNGKGWVVRILLECILVMGCFKFVSCLGNKDEELNFIFLSQINI